MSEASVSAHPWEDLEEIIRTGNGEALVTFLMLLPPEETAYTITQLEQDDRTRMLALLSAARPDFAADLMGHFADEHAATMLDALEHEEAAAIVEEMDSDEQADVLAELDDEDAEAILQRMDPEEADDARERLQYDEDTAGGLMITEVLAYRHDSDVDDVIEDLREHAAEYHEFETRFVYVVDEDRRFVGVVPMRSLVVAPHGALLIDLLESNAVTVQIDAHLDELEDLFDRIDHSAVPVLDADNRFRGVVQRAAVREARSERSDEALLKLGGIIGGEELRSMPLNSRTARRLAFLVPNILLSFVAVSIIAMYEPLIERLTVLAVFLPMVANLSGAAGNQAVAVSIRELSLGLVMPRDLLKVIRKEAMVGLVNGLIIGMALTLIVLLVRDETLGIALVIGGSYTLNSVLAVCFGGGIPLMMRRLNLDPAMMSSPLLTTITDMSSFFLTLSFAAILLRATTG